MHAPSLSPGHLTVLQRTKRYEWIDHAVSIDDRSNNSACETLCAVEVVSHLGYIGSLWECVGCGVDRHIAYLHAW